MLVVQSLSKINHAIATHSNNNIMRNYSLGIIDYSQLLYVNLFFYKLQLPPTTMVHPMFHISQLRCHLFLFPNLSFTLLFVTNSTPS